VLAVAYNGEFGFAEGRLKVGQMAPAFTGRGGTLIT
jgi:hypothetical protein